jgi:RNA polymerase sigma-70 factor (ECF subfamily)
MLHLFYFKYIIPININNGHFEPNILKPLLMNSAVNIKQKISLSKSEKDTLLLQQIAKGNQEAFKELYISYQPRLIKFCSRILKNDIALASDMADEALIAVWESAGSFSGKSLPSTWIHSIARFRLIGYLRKSKEVLLDDDSASLALIDQSLAPEEEISLAEESEQVLQGIGKLSKKHREVIELVYFRELSVKETADMLNISENTVKTRMFYARNNLKTLISNNNIFKRKL